MVFATVGVWGKYRYFGGCVRVHPHGGVMFFCHGGGVVFRLHFELFLRVFLFKNYFYIRAISFNLLC